MTIVIMPLCTGISPSDTIKFVGLKLLIFTLLFLLFGAGSVFAVAVSTSNAPTTATDQPFNIDVSVAGASAGINYLRIDLYKDGTTNYFGETYNNNIWYNGSDGKQYFPITIISGQTWTGSIQGRVGSPSTTEFPNSGIYKLKVRRYTSSGSSSSSDQQIPQDIQINLVTTSPSPSSSETSTLSPTPAPSPYTSSFTISNIPSEINSDQSFSVTVNLSSLDKPNTKFYLKGAFRKPGSTNYFGLTKVSGNWIKNSSTYSDQNQVTADSSGNWAGNLEIKPDIDDLGYTGSDDYSFKVGKYDSTDSNPSVSWSNEITIKIIDSGNTSAESSTPKPTAKNASSNPPSPTSTKSTTKSPQPKSYARLVYHSATVAGATASAASNPTVEIKSQKQTNPIIWVGLILVFTGTSMIGYIYFRKNAKIRKIRI